MSNIPHTVPGLYQVLIEPVSALHDWHHNVQKLLDLEYAIKLMTGVQPSQRQLQQVPSGEIHSISTDVQTKAHDDKPFFAAAMRVAVLGATSGADELLCSLSTFASLIQHGGRPLSFLTETAYVPVKTHDDLCDMFTLGQAYRSGFLVNSWELTSLAHIPPADIAEHRPRTLDTLETLPAPDDHSLSEGTPIGVCHYADRDDLVCIPPGQRNQHVHVIGRPGCGKSTLLESMILYDIAQGHGVAVLDPHGRLALRLLGLLPSKYIDRVIYIDPGDPAWVPIWNPLRCGAQQMPGRVADDLVSSFRTFVTGWGDRLEHLLRQAFLGVLHLANGNLLDVANLLRKGSGESVELRQRVLKVVEHQVTRLFWERDFDNYNKNDLAPPQHKLSKLLSEGTVSWMLSQSDSAFDFRSVMDSGKILIVNLANIGPDARNILGCFMLSLMHLAAIGRSAEPDSHHKPFHIYCDEAHRFVTDAVEDLIAETRKFNVSLTLAHQYMGQLTTDKTHAVASVGSSIIFNVNSPDAIYLRKDLQGRVEIEQLTTLEVGEAIARIGSKIVRIKTQDVLAVPQQSCRDLIIERSRQRYYRPIEEVKDAVRNRTAWQGGSSEPYISGSDATSVGEQVTIGDSQTKMFDYEEL